MPSVNDCLALTFSSTRVGISGNDITPSCDSEKAPGKTANSSAQPQEGTPLFTIPLGVPGPVSMDLIVPDIVAHFLSTMNSWPSEDISLTGSIGVAAAVRTAESTNPVRLFIATNLQPGRFPLPCKESLKNTRCRNPMDQKRGVQFNFAKTAKRYRACQLRKRRSVRARVAVQQAQGNERSRCRRGCRRGARNDRRQRACDSDKRW